eukprot:Rmarinus@m.27521
MSSRRLFVVGVGMTKFTKPKSVSNIDYYDMSKEAIDRALADSGLSFKRLQSAVAGYCYGDPTSGQRGIYESGMTGIPVINVNNNCSTASTALYTARSLALGLHDCVLAVGFERMDRGLMHVYNDREFPPQRHMNRLADLGAPKKMVKEMDEFTEDVIKMFAFAARQHPMTADHLAKVAFKNHMHGSNNPNAMIGKEIPLETIRDQRMLIDPITSYMSSPTANGSAAAIICTEKFVAERQLWGKAVEILAQEMTTDTPDSFDSFENICGKAMARRAAKSVYDAAERAPCDVDVLEVHDCFAVNEILMYEALGLSKDGQGHLLVESGDFKTNMDGGKVFTMGEEARLAQFNALPMGERHGRGHQGEACARGWVVNPSGGLESKGHPIGATGLAQCAELVWQLRGEAGKRQVEGAKTALQHNFGIGGAAVVTMYERPEESLVKSARG